MSHKIQLTQGKFAIVSDTDYKELSKHRWHAHKDKNGVLFYAERYDRKRTPRIIKMHREIMKPEKHLVIDHRNGNGLDNRRSNLRICTTAQNNQYSRKRLAKKSNTKEK